MMFPLMKIGDVVINTVVFAYTVGFTLSYLRQLKSRKRVRERLLRMLKKPKLLECLPM